MSNKELRNEALSAGLVPPTFNDLLVPVDSSSSKKKKKKKKKKSKAKKAVAAAAAAVADEDGAVSPSALGNANGDTGVDLLVDNSDALPDITAYKVGEGMIGELGGITSNNWQFTIDADKLNGAPDMLDSSEIVDTAEFPIQLPGGVLDDGPAGSQLTTSSTKKKKKKKKKSKGAQKEGYGASDSYEVPSHRQPIHNQLAYPSRNTSNALINWKPKDKIWSTSSTEERERIREFWLSLTEDERRSLVKVEKEAVLQKMKEQQRYSCSCSVCGRKRMAIEDELEVLYDAYYEELEQYANIQRNKAAAAAAGVAMGTTVAAIAGGHSLGVVNEAISRDAVENPFGDYASQIQSVRQTTSTVTIASEMTSEALQEAVAKAEAAAESSTSNNDASSSTTESSLAQETESASSTEPTSATMADVSQKTISTRPVVRHHNDMLHTASHTEHNAHHHDSRHTGFSTDLYNFGSSLTVKGGILTVADDLLKNDGRKFIEMMEHLAERRIQREDNSMLEPKDEYDEEEGDLDEELEDENDEYDDMEDEADMMTEEQRMEEGRRMFQIFAARLFEQRVFQAYREKVARERQAKLLEELDEENRRAQERELKKAREKEKKKGKKRQLKQQKEEERQRREAERLAEEVARREQEQKKAEEARKRKEELRIKREEERKAQEEERRLREEQKRLAQEEKQREKEREKQRKKEQAKIRERKRLEEEQLRQKKKKEEEALRREQEALEAERKLKEAEEVRGLEQQQEREHDQKLREAKIAAFFADGRPPTEPVSSQTTHAHTSVASSASPSTPLPSLYSPPYATQKTFLHSAHPLKTAAPLLNNLTRLPSFSTNASDLLSNRSMIQSNGDMGTLKLGNGFASSPLLLNNGGVDVRSSPLRDGLGCSIPSLHGSSASALLPNGTLGSLEAQPTRPLSTAPPGLPFPAAGPLALNRSLFSTPSHWQAGNVKPETPTEGEPFSLHTSKPAPIQRPSSSTQHLLTKKKHDQRKMKEEKPMGSKALLDNDEEGSETIIPFARSGNESALNINTTGSTFGTLSNTTLNSLSRNQAYPASSTFNPWTSPFTSPFSVSLQNSTSSLPGSSIWSNNSNVKSVATELKPS
ncbi:fungal protein [Schizosaccharomyces japonicus yFS275]|uniref:Stress response protein NST1 n=1 Tax=Schizosaccharomyces japonicus (strain yFS275 / FY16936) TaxID=402676 RepID=B6JVK9_SCHJY|nr:fungal protein [Schizosaccharomyces japonicus yFS275]EEB05410.1 fungal protein [Schizosaccharomyces japonicus yFS275]